MNRQSKVGTSPSHRQAAAVPLSARAAWQALVDHAALLISSAASSFAHGLTSLVEGELQPFMGGQSSHSMPRWASLERRRAVDTRNREEATGSSPGLGY